MMIFELDTGDDVAVKKTDFSDVVYYGPGYCNVAGFLLYELNYNNTVPAIVGK